MNTPIPSGLLVEQVQAMNARINDITTQRVAYVGATVSSNAATSFGADISQPDGTTITLTGIGASPHFMPAVGTTVTLALSGAQVVLVPSSVANGSIQPGNLSLDSPAAPTGLTLSTSTTVASDGTVRGIINVSWTAPTLTVGGAGIVGSLTYVIQYRTTGSTNFTGQAATGLAANLSVTSGAGYDVEVAAVDRVGNVGAFTGISTITAGKDAAAPGVPSTPVVGNYLGQLKITWDGLLGGAAPPSDFAYVEVHTSATTGFTPSTSTLVGQLSAAGSIYSAATYTTTMFAKLVAVDTSINKSAASAQGSGSTSQVVSADIFTGAVGSAQLASLAVTTAKINSLAVNDAQIGSMSVGKLTAGTMSVDVVVGGRYCTALTGARVEMNSTGFQKFDSGGNLIVSITGTQTLLQGNFKTASSGRRIEIDSAGSTGSIDFYSPSGQDSYLLSYTEPNSPFYESIQMSMNVGGHYLWNSINIDTIPQIAYHSAWHEFGMTAGGTGFQIGTYTSSASFTTGLVYRFKINSSGMQYFRPNGNLIIDAPEGAFENNIRFLPTGTASGSLLVCDDGGIPQSARLILHQSDDGGVLVKSWQSHLELRDPLDGGFYPIWASAFSVASDAGGKTNIKDATIDGLAAIRGLRVRSYNRVLGGGQSGPTEIGLIAQEAPPQIVSPQPGSDGQMSIDAYQYATLLAAGLQQCVAALDALTTRVTALEGKKNP